MIGRAARAWIGLTLALALLSACTPERGWIERSRADSDAAERALARGNAPKAIDLLRTIVEREVPGGVAREDARVVRQDALDRWARIELAAGHAPEALRRADQGLRLGERQDVFTANLWTTHGRAHEALGQDRQAADDYHRALVIEEALLSQALGGEDE
jgi:hypothetical protein